MFPPSPNPNLRGELKMRSRFLAMLAVLALAIGAAFVAGCGDDDDDGGDSTSAAELTATPDIEQSVDQSIASQVPEDIKSSGTLSVATDATYPPEESIAPDGKTIIGADIDLANSIAQLMGLNADVQNVTFDAIIPGIEAGKYDMGLSSFTDTKEREATVDFVTYQSVGTSFFVAADGGPDIQTLEDLCGHSVSMERGTTQQYDAEAQKAKCASSGDGDVDVQVFPDQNAATLAVTSGRAEVGMADTPPALAVVQSSDGALKISGKPYGPFPYGIALPKDSGLTQPTLDAVKALIDNGTYDKILEYWGLEDEAIDNPQINAAIE